MAGAAHSSNAHDANSHGDYHRGDQEITDQKRTFDGFLTVTAWGSVLVIQLVALLVVAFAMGLGWWAGLAAFAAIGIGAGLALKLGSAWWASLIGLLVALSVGGGLVALISRFT